MEVSLGHLGAAQSLLMQCWRHSWSSLAGGAPLAEGAVSANNGFTFSVVNKPLICFFLALVQTNHMGFEN